VEENGLLKKHLSVGLRQMIKWVSKIKDRGEFLFFPLLFTSSKVGGVIGVSILIFWF
jgi:hypothetical protein